MRGPNCHASSVIAAYWPGTGSSLATIDLTQKRIGVIQHFLTHSLELFESSTENGTDKLEHLFAYVRWKKLHPDSNWFGISAIVCIDIMELPDACCFLPVQFPMCVSMLLHSSRIQCLSHAHSHLNIHCDSIVSSAIIINVCIL